MAGVVSPVAARDLVEQARQALDRGMLPTRVFNDAALYELEKQRIFARTWVFLAHESEIPRPGDFVQRHVVDDSFVVVRDDAGQVRVLFNACRHRGMQVCRVEMGHTTRFRCAYHGWTYRTDGALAGIPHQQQVYGDDDINPAELGLISAPRVESHRGWIFVNLVPRPSRWPTTSAT